jgi:hypothetical protein
MKLLTVALILSVSRLCPAAYTVWVKTGDLAYSGTDDSILLMVKFKSSHDIWVSLGYLDEDGRNDNETHSLDLHILDRILPSWTSGKEVKCVKLYTDGDDGWLLNWISVNGEVFVNSRNTWMSTDGTEGVRELILC